MRWQRKKADAAVCGIGLVERDWPVLAQLLSL
jgi:hypothetical protein